MEVQEKRKSCDIKHENSPNGYGPARTVLKRSKNEEPIVNRIEAGGDNDVVDDGYLDSFPPGYRFCPLDVELVLCYLKKKVMGLPLPRNRIKEVNLYMYNPERLAELYKQYGEKEWYFFTPREKKYRNGIRPNRSAGDGYWKATGADREIKSDDRVVGYRKALVFYKGKAPKGDKTSWIMHEYRVHDPPPPKQDKGYNDMRLDDYVLCRIYKKSENNSIKTESKIEESSPPSIQNDCTNDIPASDEYMMHNPLIANPLNQIFFEEPLDDYHQTFEREFPSPYFSTKYTYDGIGPDDFLNNAENFEDYPSMNLDLLTNVSKAESQESRNGGLEYHGFVDELFKKDL